jgi:hypothetical protein
MNQPQMAPQAAPQMEPPKKGVGAWLWIVLVIVVLGAAGYFGWYYFGDKLFGGSTPTPTTNTPTDPTASWKTYSNTKYLFSVKYPSTLTANEENSTTGAEDASELTRITFADQTKAALITVTINDKNAVLAPNTLNSVEAEKTAKIAVIGGKQGKNYNDLAYSVKTESYVYRFFTELTAQKTVLKSMVDTVKFTTASTNSELKDLTYTNDTYKFTMTFPASWEGYKFKEATMAGITMSYYVEVPTTDTAFAKGDSTADAGYYAPFAIGVYTPAQWAVVEAEDGPKPTVLEETSEYVFTGSQANGIPPTDFKSASDIKTILDSLKAN